MLQLEKDRKAAKYFRLTIKDTSDYTISKELSLAAASADTSHISSIVEPILETLNFYGEVRELNITALQTEDIASEQYNFSASEHRNPTEREKQELLNHFCVRIGKDRVTRARLHESHIPERSFSYEPAIDPQNTLQTSEQCIPYNLEERPSILFPSPEPISTIAMLPDKPPSSIQWRGKRLSIITGIGPERIAPEWWQYHPHTGRFAERDYFKIQDELGRWLWVYRDQISLEWYLHGLWM
jgi:protein ImuB